MLGHRIGSVGPAFLRVSSHFVASRGLLVRATASRGRCMRSIDYATGTRVSLTWASCSAAPGERQRKKDKEREESRTQKRIAALLFPVVSFFFPAFAIVVSLASSDSFPLPVNAPIVIATFRRARRTTVVEPIGSAFRETRPAVHLTRTLELSPYG